jgi:ferredoxin-like protein FixX
MDSKNVKGGDFTGVSLLKMTFKVEGADPGAFITYDQSRCNGCGACALVCSANLWAVKDKAKLSPRYQELCLECAACYAVCEADAIAFRYPSGGSGIIIKHG